MRPLQDKALDELMTGGKRFPSSLPAWEVCKEVFSCEREEHSLWTTGGDPFAVSEQVFAEGAEAKHREKIMARLPVPVGLPVDNKRCT